MTRRVGALLIALASIALVRGFWMLSPVAGWIVGGLVLYVVGFDLFNQADARRRAENEKEEEVQTLRPPVVVPSHAHAELRRRMDRHIPEHGH